MQVVLVMFKADGTRRSFSLPRDVTVLGRREDCDLRIPLGDVSRKHCRLIKDGEALQVEDLGSSNGTYLNGARVQESAVQPGDALQIGPVTFFIQIDGVPADDQIQPMEIPPAAAASAGAEAGTEAPSETAAAGGNGADEALDGLPVAEAGTGQLPLTSDEDALAHLASSGESGSVDLPALADLEDIQPDQPAK